MRKFKAGIGGARNNMYWAPQFTARSARIYGWKRWPLCFTTERFYYAANVRYLRDEKTKNT